MSNARLNDVPVAVASCLLNLSNNCCNSTSSCKIIDIKYNCFSDNKCDAMRIAAGIFWADGCLCVLFAFLTLFKYSRVTVLNYSVCTPATSNMQWIWFFIFTALSSIMSGVNLWYVRAGHSKEYPVITAWLANLLSVLSLVFAVKYQWKYRERALDTDVTTSSIEETTPILPQRNGMADFLRPSKTDVFLVVLFLVSAGFFIAAWTSSREAFYWTAFSVLWLLQVVIFVMILIIRNTVTQGGPSVFIKYVLVAGVLFNALSDIPTYIWLNCILRNIKGSCVYAGLVGLILLSHVAFFFVMRIEFRRLKDFVIWNVIDKMDNPQTNHSRLQRH